MFYLDRMQRVTMLLTVLIVGLGFAVPAGAQQVNAPPGNAGVDEYLETVPEAGGNRPATRDSGGSRLSAGTRQRLAREGSDGRAAADLAARSGPQADEEEPSAAVSRRNDGLVRPIVRAAGGSDDAMGLWLPILLALAAAAALAVVVLRRRCGSAT